MCGVRHKRTKCPGIARNIYGQGSGRLVLTLQKVFNRFRRRRPAIRVTPLVISHNEVANWLRFPERVRLAAQIAIHPAKDNVVVMDRSRRSEVALASLRLGGLIPPINPRSE